MTFVHVGLGSAILVVSVPPEARFAADQPVLVGFDQDRLHLFDDETGMALGPG